MGALRKITVDVPEELMESAQKASRQGITQTVRAGLRLLAASDAYARAQQLQGKVRLSLTSEELKADR